MKTVNIKGAEYVPVSERIKEFRSKFKDYSLITEMVRYDEQKVVFKASVINPEGRTIATGFAMEKEGSTFINKTSHVENAETSAWGRALACLGILDESVASYEEVMNAQANQGGGGTFTPSTKLIKKAIPKDVLTKVSLKLEGCESVADLTEAWKECKSEIDTYPEIKTIFTTKKMLLQ